jgi:chromosomal replication initiator protein
MDLNAQWDELLLCLKHEVRPQDFEMWFKDARPLHVDGERLFVQVPNRWYVDWIQDNYQDSLERYTPIVFRRPLRLHLTYRDDPTQEVGSFSEDPAPAPAVAPEPVKPPVASRAVNVNRTQTFGSFVVGECNKFAHAAAQAVAESPASRYNPLFIYGSTGLGKTHLMHAIANAILAINPGTPIVYVTAEDFMNEMINSIRFKRMDEFRSRYREQAGVLLVDDIQFLSGKERTQEEFFFTFNKLQSSGRQIVLTSDVVPEEIKALEPRLRTRFEGGLLADMQPPDEETLLAILGQKCEDAGFHVPSDLAGEIAAAVQGNIRELEGVVNRLGALKSFYDEPITLAFARRYLPKIFTPAPPMVTVSRIIEAVARFHNLRSADITGKRRTQALTRPRHIAMYMARRHTQLSFPELGREFGGRDHSTVQHGVRKMERELSSNADLAYQVRLIEQSLNLRAR